MGTSSSYIGPKGKTPLLPSWYIPTEEEQSTQLPQQNEEEGEATEEVNQKTEQPLVAGDWSVTKSQFTRLRNNPSRENVGRALKSYVGKSSGGGRAIAKSAINGRAVAGKLSGFLSVVSKEGVREAIDKLNISRYQGESVEYVLSRIIDELSPQDGTNESAIASEAMVETMKELYELLDEYGGGLESLDNLSENELKEIMGSYISNYVFTRWTHELGAKIEEKDVSLRKIEIMENRCKEYIKSKVNIYLEKNEVNSLSSSDLGKNMTEIFTNVYLLFEDIE